MFMEAVANRTRQHTHWGKARENKVAHGTAPRPTRKESESVLNREEVLSAVFPDQEGSADVHIERSDETELRNFHTLVQQL